MSVLSFGVSFVPLYLTLIILCFPNVSQSVFLKQRCFQNVFPKDHDSVISHVACTIL